MSMHVMAWHGYRVVRWQVHTSNKRTFLVPSADSLLASTQPEVPPPTRM